MAVTPPKQFPRESFNQIKTTDFTQLPYFQDLSAAIGAGLQPGDCYILDGTSVFPGYTVKGRLMVVVNPS